VQTANAAAPHRHVDLAAERIRSEAQRRGDISVGV
jgi:hypothetical protein